MELPSNSQKRICNLYRRDEQSPTEIGAQFGISASTVRRILLRNKIRMRGPGRPLSAKD